MARKPDVALVTGAANGIGRNLALAYASAGTAVAAIDSDEDGLQSLQRTVVERGGRAACAVADVSQADPLRESVRSLEGQLGPTDLLIASAGVGLETSVDCWSDENLAKVIEVNLLGVAYSIGAVLPGMMQRRRGHLVALSSVASCRGLPHIFGYSASKAGVNALMEGIRVETKPFGIFTTIVCPGWIRTRMTAELHDRLPTMMTPEEAARRIMRAVQRRKNYCYFPAPMAWRLRILQFLPASISDWILMRLAPPRPERK